jgi:hypothetical protein
MMKMEPKLTSSISRPVNSQSDAIQLPVEIKGENSRISYRGEPDKQFGFAPDSNFLFKNKDGDSIILKQTLRSDGSLGTWRGKISDDRSKVSLISGEEFAKYKSEAGFDPNVKFVRDKNGLILANEENKELLDQAVK